MATVRKVLPFRPIHVLFFVPLPFVWDAVVTARYDFGSVRWNENIYRTDQVKSVMVRYNKSIVTLQHEMID
jgi:hypothetical protein